MSALDTAINGYMDHLIKLIRDRQKPKADFLSYTGPIDPSILDYFKNTVETLVASHDEADIDELFIILNTPGGSVEAVEKMAEIIRYHYKTVNFIVPDQAMSAGTIFCMSGDNIYMDYSSSLGPIDPQVMNNDGKWVPALGYLDMYERLIDKSKDDTISGIEFARFQNIDLAELSRYEQAKALSIELLRKWLVTYKFKDWNTHNSSGNPVSIEEKQARAKKIGEQLIDNTKWKSHSRMISMQTLTDQLQLRIEDYSEDLDLRSLFSQYSELVVEYMNQRNLPVLIHHLREAS